MKKNLTVSQQNQKTIALQTLKMTDIGAELMGGISKTEAISFLKSIGYQTGRVLKNGIK